MWRTTSLAALLALALAAPAVAAPTLEPVGDFNAPIYAASPPRDTSRLFVVERGGAVQVVRNGSVLATPFLDITGQVATDSERGLLSIAFPPDYASSHRFYLYLVAAGSGDLQIREYRTIDDDHADPASGRIVWSQAHPRGNHNGGTIQFGPDGLLWAGTGDGGGQGDPDHNAQDTSRLLGKILRIDPRPSSSAGYTVPADNPYGNAVWASGLRNPFRWSFDRVTGDLAVGDVGGSNREEIDYVRRSDGLGRGANFGWPCREGFEVGPTDCQPGQPYHEPVFDYPTAGAVTGGVVVRDPGLPTLRGRYLFIDFSAHQVQSMVLAQPRATDVGSAGLPDVSSIVAFAEDACGHVYLVSLDGTVQRIEDGAPGACVLRPEPSPTPGGGTTTTPITQPAAPAGPAAQADRTSPRVRIRIARRGRIDRRATPRIALTATEACRVTIRARVAGVKLKRVRTPLRAGRRTVVRLRASRRGSRRIYRAVKRHRRVTLVVSVTARDAAGNLGHASRRLKLRRS
jgi:glucose/arabinose dehydrogenase